MAKLYQNKLPEVQQQNGLLSLRKKIRTGIKNTVSSALTPPYSSSVCRSPTIPKA